MFIDKCVDKHVIGGGLFLHVFTSLQALVVELDMNDQVIIRLTQVSSCKN